MEAQIKKIKEMFNKEPEYLEQTEMNNKITEMKNTAAAPAAKSHTLEGIKSKINEAEEQISELKDRTIEITATEQRKNNEKK